MATQEGTFSNSAGFHDTLVFSGKQKSKPSRKEPINKQKQPVKKDESWIEEDLTPAEAIASWKRFKERYIDKVVFIKTGNA
jgi:hypothetical protein